VNSALLGLIGKTVAQLSAATTVKTLPQNNLATSFSSELVIKIYHLESSTLASSTKEPTVTLLAMET
jgi:hypothetical protein